MKTVAALIYRSVIATPPSCNGIHDTPQAPQPITHVILLQIVLLIFYSSIPRRLSIETGISTKYNALID